MSDLVEFLRHEADSRYVEGLDILIYDEGGHDEHQAEHIARWDPARVLAEVAAKRAILDAHPVITRYLYDEEAVETEWCETCDVEAPCPTMSALVQPCAEHPDFDPAWRA